MEGLAKEAFIGHYNMPWNAKYRQDFDTISVAKEDPLNQKYYPQIDQHPIGSLERSNLNAQRDAEWDVLDKQRKKDAWNVKKSVARDQDFLRSPAGLREMGMRRMDQVNAINVERPGLFPKEAPVVSAPAATSPRSIPKPIEQPKATQPPVAETPNVSPEVKQSAATPKNPPRTELPKPVETPKVAPNLPTELPKPKMSKLKVGTGLAGAAVGAGMLGASLFGHKKKEQQFKEAGVRMEGLAKVAFINKQADVVSLFGNQRNRLKAGVDPLDQQLLELDNSINELERSHGESVKRLHSLNGNGSEESKAMQQLRAIFQESRDETGKSLHIQHAQENLEKLKAGNEHIHQQVGQLDGLFNRVGQLDDLKNSIHQKQIRQGVGLGLAGVGLAGAGLGGLAYAAKHRGDKE